MIVDRKQAEVVNHEDDDKNTSKSHPNSVPLIAREVENKCKKQKFVKPGFSLKKFDLDLTFEFKNSSKRKQLEILRNIYAHLKNAEKVPCTLWKELFEIYGNSREIYRNNPALLLDWFAYAIEYFDFNDETFFSTMHYFGKIFEENLSEDLATNGTKAIFFACTREEGKDGDEEKTSKTNVNPLIESGCEEEFEKQEYAKPGLDGKKFHPDFTETDVNLSINPLLIRYIDFHTRKAENGLSALVRKPSFKLCKEHRNSFIDWIVYMTENFKLSTETLHLAVRYFDEYICKEDIGEEDRDLALVGTTAVFLACKIEETFANIPNIDKLVQYSESLLITKDDILNMEEKMLKALDFKLSYPTSYQFLQIFCHIGDIKGEACLLAQYLCDVALLYENVYYSSGPSKIAAAALALSNRLLNKPHNIDNIEVLTGYKECDIKRTRGLLFGAYDLIQANIMGYAVKAKYSTLKYMIVSVKDYEL